ncbi:MAG: hypothetical protein IPK24_23975 [Kineosporiaceae bacterium]|nr:hypothetical protein [Kineosporiaceae bacterium]
MEEMLDRAGTHLFMMRPDRFISYAKEVLQVQVSEASVQDIERVDRSTQEPHEKEYRPLAGTSWINCRMVAGVTTSIR